MRLPGVTVSREGAALGLPGEGVAPGCGRGSRLRAGLRPRRCGGGRGRVCVRARARGVDVRFLHPLCLENGTVFKWKWQSKREVVSNYLFWKGKY